MHLQITLFGYLSKGTMNIYKDIFIKYLLVCWVHYVYWLTISAKRLYTTNEDLVRQEKTCYKWQVNKFTSYKFTSYKLRFVTREDNNRHDCNDVHSQISWLSGGWGVGAHPPTREFTHQRARNPGYDVHRNPLRLICPFAMLAQS